MDYFNGDGANPESDRERANSILSGKFIFPFMLTLTVYDSDLDFFLLT